MAGCPADCGLRIAARMASYDFDRDGPAVISTIRQCPLLRCRSSGTCTAARQGCFGVPHRRGRGGRVESCRRNGMVHAFHRFGRPDTQDEETAVADWVAATYGKRGCRVRRCRRVVRARLATSRRLRSAAEAGSGSAGLGDAGCAPRRQRPGYRRQRRRDRQCGGDRCPSWARSPATARWHTIDNILDPRTGWPVQDAPRSVTVLEVAAWVSASPAQEETSATALYV